MYRSKAKATTEEIEALQRAIATPLIAIHTGMPPTPLERCHALALSHGLKEQPGHYGLDTATGEFLSEFPIEEVEKREGP